MAEMKPRLNCIQSHLELRRFHPGFVDEMAAETVYEVRWSCYRFLIWIDIEAMEE